MAKNVTKDKKEVKFVIVKSGNELLEGRAAQILYQSLEKNKKIDQLIELDLWSKVKVTIPQTDPNFKIDPLNHLPELLRYVYKNNQLFSLNTRPLLIPERLNLTEISEWLKKEKPTVILALNFLIRDLFIYLRQKEQIAVAVIAAPYRFYLGSHWAGESGDLWTVALPENREELIAEFVDSKRITVTGPLISKDQKSSLEKITARRKNKWPINGFYVALVADGIMPGQVEELVERFGAFPNLHLYLIIFSSDKEYRQRLEEKSRSFLANIIVQNIPDNFNILARALDLIVFTHDTVYLPEVLVNHLPSVVISRRNRFDSRDGELDILARKNLIYKANNLRDVVWQVEEILKNKKIVKKIQDQLKITFPQPGIEKMVDEIFSRMSK